MVTGQVSCKRQQEAKLAWIQCRVVKIDIRECKRGSQTKTQNSICVYTSVTGDNFTFVSWREVRSFIPEAMSFCVVVCMVNGTENYEISNTHCCGDEPYEEVTSAPSSIL